MLEEIIEIIREYVETDDVEITEESTLRGDINATSFDLMNIAEAIENKYGVSIPNREIVTIKTVGDIIRVVDR